MPRGETAMTLPDFPVAGGCPCGAVRYRLLAPPLSVYACHCRDCQRSSGAFELSMPVRRSDFEHMAGDVASFDKIADSGRVVRMHRCAACGCKLWNAPFAFPELLVLKPGSLDDPRWIAPIGNIWTDRRLPWVAIDLRLVNFPRQPPDRQPLYDAWARYASR